MLYEGTVRANLLQGPLEGVGPENRDFFGPEMATVPFGPKNDEIFQGPPLPIAE
jgi:hypothetical protein